MNSEHFVKVVEEALDSLPQEFRSRIRNVAILIEDMPPNQPSPQSGQQRRLLLGLFHGVPTTKKSIFDLPSGPDHIVLYQKNIEAVCSSEAEVREQIRLTVIHELGHSFGMDENHNTFDTGRVCPACLHQWTSTQCRSCTHRSPATLRLEATAADRGFSISHLTPAPSRRRLWPNHLPKEGALVSGVSYVPPTVAARPPGSC